MGKTHFRSDVKEEGTRKLAFTNASLVVATIGTLKVTGAAESSHPSGSDLVELADRFFQFVWVDIAAGADDDVFDPPGQVDLAVGDIGEIAGIKPILPEELRGGGRIAKVAAGR